VVTGSIVDVMVDLRKSSKTFGQSALFEISAYKGQLAWIPLASPIDFMYPATMPMCCKASLIIALQNLNVPCVGLILRYILIGLS
jgi:hypothetical protein